MSKGVETMLGNPTESADPSQWKHIDSRLTTGEPTQDRSRPPECRSQGCGMRSMWSHDLALIHELVKREGKLGLGCKKKNKI